MAVKLNASNSHLYTSSSNFKRSIDPYTINVWINATWNGGSRLSFVGMYDGTLNGSTATTTGLQIGTSTGAGEISCWTYGGTILVNSATGVMTPYNSKWVMVSYTFDGTTHSLYLNGNLLNTAVGNTVTGTFTQIFINGYPPTGTANETASYMVDAYTYFGRTLSQQELASIYNASGARNGDFYAELARYEFDELAEGSTVTGIVDLSGNGNTMLTSGNGTAITHTYVGTVANSNTRPVL